MRRPAKTCYRSTQKALENRAQVDRLSPPSLPEWALGPPFVARGDAAQAAFRPLSDAAPPILDRDLLTVADVAARLSVSMKTVRRLINRGELRAVRIGRVIRVRADEVKRLVNM